MHRVQSPAGLGYRVRRKKDGPACVRDGNGGRRPALARQVLAGRRKEGHEIGETWSSPTCASGSAGDERCGDLAQVDFFEVLADVAGERRRAWMFVMWLMPSRRDFAWLYPREDQLCFLDGQVRAFATSARCRTTSPTTICARRCARSWSAATARCRRGSRHSERTTCSSPASASRVPGTRSAASRRRARPSAGSTWCRFQSETRQSAIRQHSWLASMPTARPRHADGSAIAAPFAAGRSRMLPLPERSFRRGALVRLRARSTRPWPKCCPWTALNRLTPGRVSRHSAPEKAT